MAEYPKDVKLEDGDDIMAVQEMEKMFQSFPTSKLCTGLREWRVN